MRLPWTNWTGYTVHLTETCDKDMPLIITSVSTTPATTTDGEMTDVIHSNLANKDCLPNVHFVDSGYTNADIREPPFARSICAVHRLSTPVGKLPPTKDSILVILRLIGPLKVQPVQTGFLVLI